MAYFDCQIVQGGGGIILAVECNQVFAGAAITATDGVTTLSQTCPSSSPYEVQFNIPNVGTWTISGTYAGDSYSTQVVIPSSATLSPIPNGSTATPTAVIQTWLHCANIWDKNYTTINQVLADSTTLLALISSNNAVDYMARSTSWASSVCANSTAMTMIGTNNYCANSLLANSTWLNAICNSTYFESVLNVKIPTMTSNTTPSGVASADSENLSSQAAWKAFDNTTGDNSGWLNSGGAGWVQYQATSAVCIKKVVLKQFVSGAGRCKNFKIQASNDGFATTPVELISDTLANDSSNHVFDIISNNTPYLYHRLQISDNWGAGTSVGIDIFQYYGRASS